MNYELTAKRPALLGSVDAILEAHGLLRLLMALPVVLLQRSRRAQTLNVEHLDAHLREDMGLPPPREKVPLPVSGIWHI